VRNVEKHISYKIERIFESVDSVDLGGQNNVFPGTFYLISIICPGKTEIYSRTYLKIW